MHYTIFVDESGNFASERREWTVSGVMVPGKPEEAERLVRDIMRPPMIEEGFDTPRSAHLTEIRSDYSNNRAIRVARKVFDALAKAATSIRVGAVRNRASVTVGRIDEQSDTYEQTYRMMVLDLLSLLDSAHLDPTQDEVEGIHLLVARRKKKEAEELMTTRDQLLADVIDEIHNAVEVGLASQGLLSSVGDRRLNVKRASKKWGLAAADFVANTSKNEDKKESRNLVNEYRQSPLGWRIFDAFGSYEQRRARVAERDGNVAESIVRWTLIRPENSRERKERDRALHGLWERVLEDRDPYGPRAALETVMERIRKTTSDSSTSEALEDVEAVIESYRDDDPRIPLLLFRLRSFARSRANRHGDVERSRTLREKQKADRSQLLNDPAALPLIFKDDLYTISALQNRLRLQDALEAAYERRDRVKQYGEVWELFDDAGSMESFESSRLWLTTQMTLAFAESLVGSTNRGYDADDSLLRKSLKRLENTSNPIQEADANRLRNYKLGTLSTLGEHTRAVKLAEETLSLSQPDRYDIYYALRAATNAALADQEQHHEAVHSLLEKATSLPLDKRGNPYNLIWRDLALLAKLTGTSKVDERDALQNARERHSQLSEGPIKTWLIDVLRVHAAFLDGETIELSRLLQRTADDGGEHLVQAAENLAEEEDALPAVRNVSLY